MATDIDTIYSPYLRNMELQLVLKLRVTNKTTDNTKVTLSHASGGTLQILRLSEVFKLDCYLLGGLASRDSNNVEVPKDFHCDNTMWQTKQKK